MNPSACLLEMRKHHWSMVPAWILEGSTLELHPNAAGGWFVVDRREPDMALGAALTLPKAKRIAERLLSISDSIAVSAKRHAQTKRMKKG